MALDRLRDAQIKHLRDIGASDRLIEIFEKTWQQVFAMPNFHGPLPCGVCMMAAEIGELTPGKALAGYDPIRCKTCGTEYHIPTF